MGNSRKHLFEGIYCLTKDSKVNFVYCNERDSMDFFFFKVEVSCQKNKSVFYLFDE